MLVSRRNKAAIAAAAGKSGFLTARRTQRSATVSSCPSLARSVAGGSGVELRAGSLQPGPAAGWGRARPFLWRRRAKGEEAALGGLAGAAQRRWPERSAGGRWRLGNRGATAAGRGGRRASSLPRGFAEGRADPGCFARRDGWEPSGLEGECKAFASATKSRRDDRRWVGRRLGDGEPKERVLLPWGGGESSAALSRLDFSKR